MSTCQTRNDLIEHGDLACLVAVDDPAIQPSVIEQLAQLGFGIHTVLSSEEFSAKFRSNPYDVIIISEKFSNSGLESNPALADIAVVPLTQRRELFVVLIGPNMTSRSEMQAFMHSVDLAVNDVDAANLKTIVGRGIVRQEEFYAAFNSVLKAVRAG